MSAHKPRHARPSPLRWLVTLPPAAGLVTTITIMAMPAMASAATMVHAAPLSAFSALAEARIQAQDTPALPIAQVDAAIAAHVLARREAAKDARQEARQDARQAARAAALAAAQAAARAARQARRASTAPAQIPTSSAPTPAGIFSYSQLEALWVSAGGPSWAEAQAAQIAECESGGNPNAYNPSGATGLWQILGAPVGWTGSTDWTIPSVNAAAAVAKFNESGQTFAQWVCQ